MLLCFNEEAWSGFHFETESVDAFSVFCFLYHRHLVFVTVIVIRAHVLNKWHFSYNRNSNQPAEWKCV